MKFSAAMRTYLSVCGLSALCWGVAGCGGDELTRHQVSGTVMFQGKPVESGAIAFEPELSVGTLAPSTYARIENGQFKTAREQSPATGSYRVRVNGADETKRRIVDGISVVPPIFREYVLQIEIPPPDGRLDIVVPGELASK